MKHLTGVLIVVAALVAPWGRSGGPMVDVVSAATSKPVSEMTPKDFDEFYEDAFTRADDAGRLVMFVFWQPKASPNARRAKSILMTQTPPVDHAAVHSPVDRNRPQRQARPGLPREGQRVRNAHLGPAQAQRGVSGRWRLRDRRGRRQRELAQDRQRDRPRPSAHRQEGPRPDRPPARTGQQRSGKGPLRQGRAGPVEAEEGLAPA